MYVLGIVQHVGGIWGAITIVKPRVAKFSSTSSGVRVPGFQGPSGTSPPRNSKVPPPGGRLLLTGAKNSY